MRNKGMRQYRFKDNPMEKRFAEEWEKINIEPHNGTLAYILAEEPNKPMGEVYDRDVKVAATVIQWLGSPVGQAFVRKVLEEGEE